MSRLFSIYNFKTLSYKNIFNAGLLSIFLEILLPGVLDYNELKLIISRHLFAFRCLKIRTELDF